MNVNVHTPSTRQGTQMLPTMTSSLGNIHSHNNRSQTRHNFSAQLYLKPQALSDALSILVVPVRLDQMLIQFKAINQTESFLSLPKPILEWLANHQDASPAMVNPQILATDGYLFENVGLSVCGADF